LAAAGRAAAKAIAEKATLLLARARLKQGNHLNRLGDYQQAMVRFDEAGTLFQSLSDNGGLADSLRYEGGAMVERGEFEAGDKKLAAALALAQPLHYVRLTTEILNLQANEFRLRGNLHTSLRAAEAALASAREADDQAAVGRTLLTIGSVVRLQGDFARARVVDAEAEQILRKAGSNRDADAAVNNLLVVDLAQGRLTGMRDRFEALLAADRKAGVKSGIATRLVNLSRVRLLEGDLAEAERLTVEECGIYETLASKANLASCRIQLAGIQYELGRAADARVTVDSISLSDAKRSPQPPTDLARLATVHLRLGDRASASAILADADRSLSGRDYVPEQSVSVSIARARLESATGGVAVAMDRLKKAQREAEKFDLAPLTFDARLALAELSEPAARRTVTRQLALDAKQAGLNLYAQLASRLDAGTKTPEHVRVSNVR
jgi:tetratricopeptide (TPR) repeat protein